MFLNVIIMEGLLYAGDDPLVKIIKAGRKANDEKVCSRTISD